MAQSILSSLKLVDRVLTKVRGEYDPLPDHRAVLIERLQNNKSVAEGQIKKEPFIVRRNQHVIDPETKKVKKDATGKPVTEMLPVKRFEPDFIVENGLWFFQVKKARDVLATIEVGKSFSSMPKVIDQLIKAAEANEFDDKLREIWKTNKEKRSKKK